MKRFLLAFVLLFSFSIAADDDTFLPVEQAFPYQWSVSDSGLQLHFAVHPDYYLYKSRFKFTSSDGVTLLAPEFSWNGKSKKDQYFGEVTVFDKPVTISLPYQGAGEVKVRYQGCANKGLCYLPQTFEVVLPNRMQDSATSVWQRLSNLADDTKGLSSFLDSASRMQALLVFFLLGLGLSLTPCVLPMVPILSSIIGGDSQMTGRKGLLLSSSYVLGMATSYALTGILVTTVAKGINLQAAMQQPWLLSLFAGVFVLLALAMFGFFELQLPSALQNKLNTRSDKLGGGRVLSVFVMGAISALVVSPCVSAPLAGALLYVSTTQDWVFGGITLFVMALGMGIPLILIGVSGGKLLPKSGPWMIAVKQLFGVLLLGVAIVLLSRFIPAWVTILIWSMLAIGAGIHFGALDAAEAGWARTRKFAAFLSLFYGLVLFVGYLLGNEDPLNPLEHANKTSIQSDLKTAFNKVNTIEQLNLALASAKSNKQPVVVDLYADWCVSCKVIEKEIFNDSNVREKLKSWSSIKLDVTDSTPEQMAWLAERDVFGPPAIFFYSPEGVELESHRIAGGVDLEKFQQKFPNL
ncbi:protein-disulfide reductase DsbD [Vibrio europaeus]|uniref:Protein-disulfide reductase DsbD n=1 Tax=Vibrio europaeus TaxID=300876 RepID=A0AAE7B0Z1_9VIBR|nr:protein-disulfide reductase DsbD [Vibrio europaeus]MDC5805880.1 protein-disulfide reductase DsbD [Vibrio europaeus]MDC5812177.1 protein-disulfide reductase DsbD [Vibrio europaeus]MDC5826048.1 protein-disulfide reductase DsbD [Vibrio europaeus]MDC5831411.1 protein-disulfide reductase DsbD [Vibrio europaeus]MDC5834367.1 protein-disulfide reductase DsbD [Vibrio europaeus]